MSQPNSDNNGFMSAEMLDLVHGIFRKKWWILICGAVLCGAVTAGTLRQPKIYRATAQIIIDPVLPKVLGESATIDDLSEQARTEGAFYNTQYRIIRSRAVLQDAVARLGLADDPQFLSDYAITATEPDAKMKALEQVLELQVQVEPEPKSRVVRISVEDRSADRAAKIANAVANAYMDHTLERRVATGRAASKWLDQRVEEYGAKLESAERALYEFKKQHSLVSVSVEDRKNMTTTALNALNDALLTARTKRIEAESRLTVLEQLLAEPDTQVTGEGLVPTNSLLGGLRRDIAELQKKVVELSTRYGDKHPNLQAVQLQLQEAKLQLQGEVKALVTSLQADYRALKRTEEQLAASMEDEKTQALVLNNLALDYNKLSRDFGTTETMYQTLLKRQAEAGLSERLEANFVRWLETAEPEPLPIRPSVPKNAAAGLALGLVLGLLLAAGAVLLDNTVHSQTDIEGLLRLPFLGVLPSIADAAVTANGKPLNRDLYIASNPNSSVAECARSIRTNLLFAGTDRQMRRLLLTSAGPSEGKSTTSISLGITMAQAGNRVLIVDTDLRRARLHKTFRTSGTHGLTSILVDAATIEQAVVKTEIPGLDILPCGPTPPNPAELIHTDRFKKLLDNLNERYDLVLLDSPPVNAVTDAVVLSQCVDGTVLVVRASKTAKEAARRAARSLQDVGANILGVVLNDLDFEDGGYRHHYYYYRGGYYGDTKTEAGA